jgi:hypothetical protein
VIRRYAEEPVGGLARLLLVAADESGSVPVELCEVLEGIDVVRIEIEGAVDLLAEAVRERDLFEGPGVAGDELRAERVGELGVRLGAVRSGGDRLFGVGDRGVKAVKAQSTMDRSLSAWASRGLR